jgi:phosphoribosylglycinamide formyltransferase-1
MLDIVVLISGNGSNLQAIIDAIENHKLKANIKAVISDQENAYGLQRAQDAGIATYVLTAAKGEPRAAYDERLRSLLIEQSPDLIVLAGFMRILSPEFVKFFSGKIINIHPSLLPKYRGLHTHKQVLANKDTEHGVSIHFVTEDLDGGPIIAQTIIKVKTSDTEKILKQRVHRQEHKLYPQVINWFANKRIRLRNNQVLLDDIILPAQGLQVAF